MTFKEKLEEFKSERVGFRVNSEEIADELAKVLDADDRFKDSEGCSWEALCDFARSNHENKTYIAYDGSRSIYGSTDEIDGCELQVNIIELLDVTLEELKEYNG